MNPTWDDPNVTWDSSLWSWDGLPVSIIGAGTGPTVSAGSNPPLSAVISAASALRADPQAQSPSATRTTPATAADANGPRSAASPATNTVRGNP